MTNLDFIITPSNWRGYNITPDTYHLFNGDGYIENELYYFNESMTPEDFKHYFNVDKPEVVDYDFFDWNFNHQLIVQEIANELTDWVYETLGDELNFNWGGNGTWNHHTLELGLVSTWSPKYYNFDTDSMEIEVIIGSDEFDYLTKDFDLDKWVEKYYQSTSGFASFVPERIKDEEYRQHYHREFGLEYAICGLADPDNDWKMRVWDKEHEIYSNNLNLSVA